MNEIIAPRKKRFDVGPGARPYRRKGQYFDCQYCGTTYYKKASELARAPTRSCGDKACVSQAMQKENNPFWGKEHSEEVRSALKAAKSATPHNPGGRGRGRKTGSKDGPEARARKSERMKKRWAENREKMLSLFQTPPKAREEQRYRQNFTPWQRLNWKGTECAWCSSVENLVLDHIVPVTCGGVNIKENAQTLCQPCNLWKSHYVDRPHYLARLAIQGGSGS